MRYLPHCYRGIELNSLRIKTTAAAINSFLQHHGTKTSLSLYLTASIENLQLELGVSRCLFEYDYYTWNKLATDSWVKLLLERVHKFYIQLVVDYKPLPLSREYNKCIMEIVVNGSVKGHELVVINRVRKHQHVIFLSNIAAVKKIYRGDLPSKMGRFVCEIIRQALLALRFWHIIPHEDRLGAMELGFQHLQLRYHVSLSISWRLGGGVASNMESVFLMRRTTAWR